MEKDAIQEVLDKLPEKFEGRDFVLVSDISSYLEITPRTVHGLIDRGELPAFKVGKEYRIPVGSFRKFLEDSAT